MLTLAVVLAVVCVCATMYFRARAHDTSARCTARMQPRAKQWPDLRNTDPNRENCENRVNTVLKTVRKLYIIPENR